MNVSTFAPTSTIPASSLRNAPVATSARRIHRARDFGVGYGSSSGYASARPYATPSSQRLFRFA